MSQAQERGREIVAESEHEDTTVVTQGRMKLTTGRIKIFRAQLKGVERGEKIFHREGSQGEKKPVRIKVTFQGSIQKKSKTVLRNRKRRVNTSGIVRGEGGRIKLWRHKIARKRGVGRKIVWVLHRRRSNHDDFIHNTSLANRHVHTTTGKVSFW